MGGRVLDISKLRLTQSSLAGSWPELGNIIIMGFNIENDDFLQLNTTLTKSVQNFILKTKRFEID